MCHGGGRRPLGLKSGRRFADVRRDLPIRSEPRRCIHTGRRIQQEMPKRAAAICVMMQTGIVGRGCRPITRAFSICRFPLLTESAQAMVSSPTSAKGLTWERTRQSGRKPLMHCPQVVSMMRICGNTVPGSLACKPSLLFSRPYALYREDALHGHSRTNRAPLFRT